MRNAHRDALESLLRETRAARVADRLPEDRRPRGGVLISIGAGKGGSEDDEASDDEAEDTEPAAFEVGDRVRVRAGKEHDEATAGTSGTIVEVNGTAFAIEFDGMGVHRWYVAEELEATGDDLDEVDDDLEE